MRSIPLRYTRKLLTTAMSPLLLLRQTLLNLERLAAKCKTAMRGY
jgi:hypothetical protein